MEHARPAPLPEIQYVEVRGVRLAYREAGVGEPVLLLHGSLAGLDTFRRQVAAFSRHFRVITMGRRFHPPSGPETVTGDYVLAEQALDVRAFIAALALGRPHIVGSSYGGYVAIGACLMDGSLAASLTVAEPPMLRSLEGSTEGRKALQVFHDGALVPARLAFAEGNLADGAALFFDGIRGERGSFAQLREPVRKELLKFAPELRLELTTDIDLFMPPIDCEALRRLTVPTLLLGAGKSPPFFHHIVAGLERCLPDARTRMIRGADHSIHTSAPTDYNAAVLEFLGQHRKRSA